MVNFQLKNTELYKALLLEKVLLLGWARALRNFFALLFPLFFLLFFLREEIPLEVNYLGFGLFSFSLFLLFLEVDLFFRNYLKKPKLLFSIEEAEKDLHSINLAEFLDFESAKIIEKAQQIGKVDSYIILLAILKYSSKMDFVFYRALIDKQRIVQELEKAVPHEEKTTKEEYEESFFKIIEEAFFVAKKRGNKRITPEDIFVALGEHNSFLQGVFYEEELKKDDLINLTSWQLKMREKENPLVYRNLVKKGKLGIEWASGHTPLLDRFSVDWTKKMKFANFPETIGHQEEASSLERVLSRDEINSPLLVGEPGSGRRSIIQGVIRKSFLGESLPQVNFKRFLELNMSSLLSQTEGMEKTEAVLEKVFSEAANAGNVILFINDFHNFVEGGQRPGVVDISGIIEPYLHLPSFRIIGITSYDGFHKKIEKSLAVSSCMEKVEVREVSKEDTLRLLKRKTLFFEKKYRKLVSFAALKKIIYLADRYIQDTPFPEKAVDLLEESIVHINQTKEDILLPHHVEKIVSERVEVPVGRVGEKEKEVLLNMEKLLHERMVNQEQAVKATSLALRRSRAEVDTRKALIGSFLFLGPTGVGKTEMAKAIAAVYFGSAKRINRIDMSEFQTSEDVSRLIGSSREEGIITLRVREDPFSLILLDEIEKAHPDILNLFLQVLDEGHLTDGNGRKVDFKNSMLIATSNAGSQTILNAIEKDEDWGEVKKKILRRLFRDSVFRPEFVNRFDEVVLFKPLSKEDLFNVAELQLRKLAKSLKEQEMNFIVTDDLKRKIVEMSYDPVFGAREMQRTIQNTIGDVLSSAILKEKIKKGESFSIDPEEFTIKKE